MQFPGSRVSYPSSAISRVVTSAVGALLSLMFIHAALAQTSPSAADQAASTPAAAAGQAQDTGQQAGESAQLQEVVVTAEKRESDLQKTPVAVTAVSQNDLQLAGVYDYDSIQKVAPDVNITNSAAGPVISIRGIYTTQANNEGAEGDTAQYLNGAYLQQEVMQGMLFDLERVEVDKGPQTTLYGKDAVAGAINFVTNMPVLGQTSGEGDLERGDYDSLRTAGVMNIPIGDTFAVRAAFQTYSHNGYMDSGLDDADLQSARLSALWRPSNNESLYIVADYELDRSNDDQAIVSNVIGVRPGSPAAPGGSAPIYVPPNPWDDTFYDGNANGQDSRYYIHSVNEGLMIQNDYELGFATWTTLLSARHYNMDWLEPSNLAEGEPTVAPNGLTYPGGAVSWTPQTNQDESLEMRLTSTSTQPWQWVAGVYLYNSQAHGTMIAYAGPHPVVSSDPAVSTQQFRFINPQDDGKAAAVFGQATFTPPGLSALHLTAGGRLESDYKNQDGTATEFGLLTASQLGYSSNTWHNGTYRLEVSYDVTPNSLLYADTATAYKAGGFGYGPGEDPAVGPIVQPEHITAYEIGSKNRFLDQRLQVNLEAWDYHYDNFENAEFFFQCAPVCGAGFPIITPINSGEANYHGATVSLDFLITPADDFSTSVSYLYGKYGTYVQSVSPGYSLEPGAPVLSNDFLSNTYIPGIPRWSGIASYTHTWQNVLHGSVSGVVATQFQGSELQNLVQDPVYGTVNVTTGGWAMLDLSLIYQHQEGTNWSVRAYVHNVANRVVPTTEAYSDTVYDYTASFYPPRTFGVALQAKF